MKENSKKWKGVIAFVVAIVMICGVFAAEVSKNSVHHTVYAADSEKTIIMKIGSNTMVVNGKEQNMDSDSSIMPVIVSGRTLVPLRSVVEAMGGNVEWNNTTKKITLNCNHNVIKLTLNQTDALVNDNKKILDVAPTVKNNRTLIPFRFVSENFGFHVEWDAAAQTITMTGGTADMSNVEQQQTTASKEENQKPVVYMTTDISPEGLLDVYNKLGFEAEGNVAVKISTGEPPASNYLRPELIADLVQSVNGTIVECNTAYGSSRASTAMHKQVAKDHGFTEIANVDIMDENGSMEIPITAGENINVDYVGKNLANYDSMIALSHFKGHAMAGYGGAIKNMSIGVASSEGKNWIHTAGKSRTSFMGGEQEKFLESMAEATSGVIDYLDGKVVYINVMNRISIDCDCDGNPAEPDMHDVGILASTDPVALDQACIDIVYATPKEQSGTLMERIESRNGLHTLEHAEKIGLGSRSYELVNID